MLCSGAEWLFSLGGVYFGQADFVLLFIHQQDERIAVNNSDDFALMDGFGGSSPDRENKNQEQDVTHAGNSSDSRSVCSPCGYSIVQSIRESPCWSFNLTPRLYGTQLLIASSKQSCDDLIPANY